MKKSRLIKNFTILVSLILLLVACSNDTNQDKANSDKKIGLVVSAAGRNDTGYNKNIADKLDELSKKEGFHLQIVDPSNGVDTAIETLAGDGYQIIFSMEYDFEALINGVGGSQAIAEQYPDTTFVIFNDNPNVTESGEVKHKNVISVLYNVNEPSYLAGYLYVLMNENQDRLFGEEYKLVSTEKSRAAGFIGGTNSNGILVYSYGFIQGINDAAKEFDVKYDYYAKYDAGFSDPATGSAVAGTYFDNGANVVFADAGTVGVGITSKAKEVNRLSVEVDANLDDRDPGNIITSVLKLTDIPAENIVNEYLNGKISEMDNLQTFGLESKATEITDLSVISKHIKDSDTWKEIIDKVDAKRQSIINGDLGVVNAQAGEKLDDNLKTNVTVK